MRPHTTRTQHRTLGRHRPRSSARWSAPTRRGLDRPRCRRLPRARPRAGPAPLLGGAAVSASNLAQAEPGMAVELTDAQLERLADLVAERLRTAPVAPGVPAAADESRPALVSAAELAGVLGVSRAWVYEHASELGAIRLGEGSRARLRFEVEAARAALSRYGSNRSDAHTANGGGASVLPTPRRRRSLASHRPEPGSILPVRPRQRKAAP